MISQAIEGVEGVDSDAFDAVVGQTDWIAAYNHLYLMIDPMLGDPRGFVPQLNGLTAQAVAIKHIDISASLCPLLLYCPGTCQ